MADAKNFQAKAFSAKGTSRDAVNLPSDLFDGTVHMPAMHQAVKAYLANQRQGTAKTKTRSFVAGGNQKPWKQKGTGRARQGSIRAPHFVGGGTVFGPIPRSYAQYVPRQVRALARKSALNARAREGAIVLVEALDFDAPKTKHIITLLEKVGGTEKKVLILTNGAKPNVFLSGRNLPKVHVMPYSDVSTYHILWSDLVVIEDGAFDGKTADTTADTTAATTADTKATSARKRVTGAKKTSAPKQEAKAKKTAARAKAKTKVASEKKPAAKKAAKKKEK
ncbi:MAG TPA: 50S ribosomal protein L4 [Gemmatimonadaceae bacterium]|nr:50S ribosomal protein L4 [Gemmatimonadaceae bacterium]